MDKSGRQTINCSVNTCNHYEQGNKCRLSMIEVCSDGFLSNAKMAKQSMCASFESIE